MRRGGQEREAIAVFEATAEDVLAGLALASGAAQSVLTEEDDDVTAVGHVAKSSKLGVVGDGSAKGSPKRIDSAVKTAADWLVKHPVSFSQSEKITDVANGKIMAARAVPVREMYSRVSEHCVR